MNDAETQSQASVTSLVQHIELNESGWWGRAVERLVLASCLSTVETRLELVKRIEEACGLKQSSEQVRRAIDRLIADGSIIELDGVLHLSEEMRERLEVQLSAVSDSEARVRERFLSLASSRNLEISSQELWNTLETEVILPTVRLMGARMYAALKLAHGPGAGELETNALNFVSEYDEEVRTLFVDFLDPKDEDTRKYVLRRLSAQYAIDAAALPDDVLSDLGNAEGRAKRIDVFLDTNVVFSILGLHENPSNDVSVQLLELIEDIRRTTQVRLYVIPETFREARNTIGDTMESLKEFRGQGNLAAAASRMRTQGLLNRYLKEASLSPRGLTPREFFGPYESDLLTILRRTGVELFNTDLGHLHTDQDVIDDVHNQEEIQAQFRSKGAKPYDANIHDMVLWHFVAYSRREAVEAPLDVNAWIVTLDYGFIRFDRSKRQDSDDLGGIPICVDPSTLVQIMQFWTPSTQSLEQALVGSVRQPLLFLPFDGESEQVTLRILRQLSRYENSDDLEVGIASEILMNQALRNRMSERGRDAEFDQQVVQEEIVALAQDLQNQLREAQSDVDRLTQVEERAATEASERKTAERLVERLRVQRDSDATDRKRLQEELSNSSARLREVEGSYRELNAQLEEIRYQQQRHQARKRLYIAVAKASGFGLVLAAAVVALANLVPFPIAGWAGGIAAGLWVSLWHFERMMTQDASAPELVLQRVSAVRKAWWAFVLAVAASIVGDLVA